ncbi:hypothetical protein GCM10011506_38620 [Marivirga lumbricoides]|uniref:Lipoprotein n=1 Tax=Marivirga lumbricoides TaxID=1046115 RepID=A0ABQ1MY38_9BACT|nr:hypothetical protein GCM10011506_38620 [Marivirga lumbricoides]
MNYKYIILSALILYISCANPKEEKGNITSKTTIMLENEVKVEKNEKINPQKVKEQIPTSDCVNYWKNRFPNDSLKAIYIDSLISQNQLPENNLLFLNALKTNTKKDLAFKNVLSPIFRLSETEIGLLTFASYQLVDNKFIADSKEEDLISKYHTNTSNTFDHYGKIQYYPTLLDSLYRGQTKPSINFYTINKAGASQVMQLGKYVDECLEYFEYTIDTSHISVTDTLLFSSPFKIDLVFESNAEVDLLLQNDYKEECLDCPSSIKLQKTFARVKGVNNLYFVYADTFPINNELDTPSRALVLITQKDEIKYLWYSEIDLFGCSCL